MANPDIYTNFVKNYKTAMKLKWSRANLADYLGYEIDSLRRKVDKINYAIGINFPHLPLNSNPLTATMVAEFEKLRDNIDTTKVTVRKSSRTYLITSAQNATPIHSKFFDSCMEFCKDKDAEFIVVPYRYKNPTSIWSIGDAEHEWWAKQLVQYLVNERVELCNNLIVLGNIKIQPTQSEPLSGLEGFGGTDSTIVGHPKIQLRSVPTLNGKPKLMLTTGSVTVSNYTDSKAGHKADFHHSIGAVVVEVDDDGIFHVRHVHGNDKTGAFYDLNNLYTPSGVTSGHRIEALITGDTHAEFIDEIVEDVTYHNEDSIVSLLRPKKVFLHDVLDFYNRNHHHRGNDILAYGKQKYGRNNVQDGLQEAADFIDRISRKDMEVVVVKSNHDEAFDRWLRETDIKNDPENMDFFYYMKYHQMKSIKMSETGFDSFDPFKFWCLNPENDKGLLSTDSTRFLKRDESVKIGGVELGFHGDVGINGSRGDIKGLARTSSKMVIGHSHSPGIYEGCYQVGLSAKMNLEYKKGPSTWMTTHAILYPDGKRTLIHVSHGKWKGS
jgi:hypothetical protein